MMRTLKAQVDVPSIGKPFDAFFFWNPQTDCGRSLKMLWSDPSHLHILPYNVPRIPNVAHNFIFIQ